MKSHEIPDPDLTTPVHDEIMLWLDNKFRDVPARIVGYETYPAISRHDYKQQQLNDRDALVKWVSEKGFTIDVGAVEVKACQANPCQLIWEMAVPGKTSPIGFIDLYARTYSVALTFEQRIDQDYCGTPDCNHPECWKIRKHVSEIKHLAFEVKSTISSLGELIRQIRRYEAALPWCKCPYQYGQQIHHDTYGDHFVPRFYVVSPDTRRIEAITNQGIGFIEYPTFIVSDPR